MLKINKILNYLIVLSILFLIGKSIYDNHIEKQKLNQSKYEFVLSLDEARNVFPSADSVALDAVSSYLVVQDNIE